MNILLIEPDRLLANTFAKALQKAGHEVRDQATGQAAIFAIDEARPDLILLELQLVGHSGMEFLYELRSYPEWQDIPVVVLSNVPAAEFWGSQALGPSELNIAAYHYKPRTSLRHLAEVIAGLSENPAQKAG